MCICLWPEFDCPGVTLCGWQDIKIQLITNSHTTLASGRGSKHANACGTWSLWGSVSSRARATRESTEWAKRATREATEWESSCARALLCPSIASLVQPQEGILLLIIMYIYHALFNALSAHMIHINLTMIFYTHVEHSSTQTIHLKHQTQSIPTALATEYYHKVCSVTTVASVFSVHRTCRSVPLSSLIVPRSSVYETVATATRTHAS